MPLSTLQNITDRNRPRPVFVRGAGEQCRAPLARRSDLGGQCCPALDSTAAWYTRFGAIQDGSYSYTPAAMAVGLLFIEAALIVSDRLRNAIDRHVASRLLLRRREAGLTQQMVADALSVTFQQFQKYERAINRISAGTLYQLSLTLEVPVQYFFEGLSGRRNRPR